MQVFFANEREYEAKVSLLLAGGRDSLKCVADFDFTLTQFWSASSHETVTDPPQSLSTSSAVSSSSFTFTSTLDQSSSSAPVRLLSCHRVLEDCGLLDGDYHSAAQQLQTHYYPLEVSPELDLAAKTEYMVEWVTKAHDLLLQSRLTSGMLREATRTAFSDRRIRLRRHAMEVLQMLSDSDVPVLVLSAGIADVIETVFELAFGTVLPNIHVISNRCIFDGQRLVGFEEPLLHVFNKKASAFRDNSPFFSPADDTVRCNLLLIGDSIGDVGMSDGLDFRTCLKIGFLNDREERIEEYLQAFDVVVTGDPGMDFIHELLTRICRPLS